MATLKIIAWISLFLAHSCFAEEYRLPELVTPAFYHLDLNINPESDEYSGIANITFRTDNVTKDIYIHSDIRYINMSLVILNNNAKCYVDDIDLNDVLIMSCTRPLILEEDNSIYIEFTSKFSFDGYGLFKSTYMDGEKEVIMIESNFKPTYARRAFPCLDEPDFKARFSVEITYPKGYTALSTSPAIDSTDVSDDLQTSKFEVTPQISPHLLTIFISKFEEADTSAEDGVDFKILTRSDATSLTESVAGTYYHQIIEKINEYTGVPYKKLNETESYLVAIPDYFDAMGDFGLFTYRETELLDEGDQTTNRAKQNIILAMAYKLSHEWYGGNVATKWWSDVWANEAVATYMKYIISDQVDETLELSNQFPLEITRKSLEYESYSFAQPLSSEEYSINDKWLIKDKLSSINYEKGASILHMFSLIVGGKDAFQSSLQKHFQNRREAETDGIDIMKDVLDGMSAHFDIDYTYLQNWIFSAGYPLITVSLQEETNTTDIANVTQKRFLYPTDDPITEDSSTWYVPLTSALVSNNPSDVHIDVFLTPGEHTMFFYGHDMWIIVNSDSGCFYRVNYDVTLWRKILDGWSANKDEFRVLQRSHLLDDIFSVARIGDVDYSLAFEMADLLANETEYYPWYSALNAFSYLLGKLENSEVESNLKDYILNLMEDVIEVPSDTFVVDNDTHIDVLKKVMLLDWACNLGHEESIAYTTEKFNQYKESQDSLDDYNARSVIFCNGIRHSKDTQKDWDFLWTVYTTSSSVHEQNDILNALGCVENKDILLSYLEKIVTTNSGIKRQDVSIVFKSIFSSSLGIEVAMEFLKNNIREIEDFYNDIRILSEMIYSVAEKLISDEQINWLKDLLSNAVLVNFEEVRTKANTLAAVNKYWKTNFRGAIVDIFPPTITESSPETSPTDSSEATTQETPTTTESKGYTTSAHILLYFLMALPILFNYAHII